MPSDAKATRCSGPKPGITSLATVWVREPLIGRAEEHLNCTRWKRFRFVHRRWGMGWPRTLTIFFLMGNHSLRLPSTDPVTVKAPVGPTRKLTHLSPEHSRSVILGHKGSYFLTQRFFYFPDAPIVSHFFHRSKKKKKQNSNFLPPSFK